MSNFLNREKKRARKKFIKHFAVFFVAFIVITTAGWVIADKIGDWAPFQEDEEAELVLAYLAGQNSEFFAPYADQNRVNILLVGTNDGMSDTIMLASLNLDTKKVSLISIPRDTYHEREGYTNQAQHKINAIYNKEGIAGTISQVSDLLLGIPINYYAVIDYDGVKNIVNAMDGVPIDVPIRMKYTDVYDKPPLYIDLQPGYQVLYGDEAVQFLRFRKGDTGYPQYPEGDVGRVKAQQEFMKSAFKQCLSFDIIKIARTVFNNVDSNLDIASILGIARKSLGITGEDVETFMLPGESMEKTPYYYISDSEEIAEMLILIYDPPEPEPEELEDGIVPLIDSEN